MARESGISQPTVSRQIAALEADLGVRLLNRTTRKVSPTDAGRALYARAAGAMQSLFEAEDDVRAGDSAMEGLVRITAPGALGRRLLLPVVTAVVAKHPGLAVDLQVSDQRVSFVDSRADFAVRVGAQSEASLSIRRVGVSEQVLVASKSYIRRHRWPRTLAALNGHAVIVRAESGAAAASLRAEFARFGARVVFSSDDIETAYLAVTAGLGVGMLPRWLVAEDLASRRLQPCASDAPEASAPVFVVRPTAGWLPRRARLVLEEVVKALAHRLGGDRGEALSPNAEERGVR